MSGTWIFFKRIRNEADWSRAPGRRRTHGTNHSSSSELATFRAQLRWFLTLGLETVEAQFQTGLVCIRRYAPTRTNRHHSAPRQGVSVGVRPAASRPKITAGLRAEVRCIRDS